MATPLHRAPVIHHLNAEYRLSNAEERAAQIDKVITVMHLKKNPANLLLHYSSYEDGEKVNGDAAKASCAGHIERPRAVLADLGIISFISEVEVNIDWKRIHLFGTYLDGEKTAKNRNNVIVEPVEKIRDHSIIADIKKHNLFVVNDDSAFDTIIQMSGAELDEIIKAISVLRDTTYYSEPSQDDPEADFFADDLPF